MAFAGVFLLMALLELAIPKRSLRAPKLKRWTTNISIVGIDIVVARLMGLFVIPLAAVAAAIYAETTGFGLLNLLDWPIWLEVLLALVILDLAIWAQHYAFHKIPILWSMHQVHHADVDIDVTTALRFHPLEIAVSMLYKILVVFILGPAAMAFVLFEVILNGCAMFNHSNVDLPRWLDRVLRFLIVTPDMHRVHHSVRRPEHDSNYGFNLSIWDRLFATYTAEPKGGHKSMTIGLPQYQSDDATQLRWNMWLPFRRSESQAEQTSDGH